MRKQIALTYMIGYSSPNPTFELNIAELATRLCGGCTVSSAVGFWAEDGAGHKDLFTGKPEREHCFKLELTCEEHKLNLVTRYMEAGISGYAKQFNVSTDWVHVKQVEFIGLHFSITEHNSKLSNRAIQVSAMSPGTKASR